MPVNAVIIVGGPSTVTDFRPLSLYQPKPLFPIAGRPLIYHHLKALAELPDLQEVFLVGYYEASQFGPFMEQVRQELKIRIRYLREFEPLGTGGGLYHFRDQIQRGEPDSIIFMHMDVCCTFPLSALLDFHRRQQRAHNGQVVGSILSTRVPKEVAKNFGCIVVDPESRQVRHYVEKPESMVSDLISCGIYVFSNLIFDEVRRVVLESELKYFYYFLVCANIFICISFRGSEFADTVMLEREVLGPLARKSSSPALFTYETREFWRQIKSASATVSANRLYLENYGKTEANLLTTVGPKIIAPVFIHPSAKVDPSAVLGPNVTVDANCVIGEGVRIKESVILPGVRIKDNACIIDSIIGWNSTIGTWSRIEGSPVASNFEDEFITLNGVKKPSVTILGKTHSHIFILFHVNNHF